MQLPHVIPLLLAAAWSGPARADRPVHHRAESMVLGANLVVALGAGEGPRLGGGLDVGYRLQWYLSESKWIDGIFYCWAQEIPDMSYGPEIHLWRVGGAWQVEPAFRFGAVWPLRVGLGGGWWPGPGLALEAGYLVSTAGHAGLDLQGVVEAPWLQLRVGQALTGQGWQARRLHAGAFYVMAQPENWPESTGDLWRRPE